MHAELPELGETLRPHLLPRVRNVARARVLKVGIPGAQPEGNSSFSQMTFGPGRAAERAAARDGLIPSSRRGRLGAVFVAGLSLDIAD